MQKKSNMSSFLVTRVQTCRKKWICIFLLCEKRRKNQLIAAKRPQLTDQCGEDVEFL